MAKGNSRVQPKCYSFSGAEHEIKKLNYLRTKRKSFKQRERRHKKRLGEDPIKANTKTVEAEVEKSKGLDQYMQILTTGIPCLELRKSKIYGQSGNGVFVSRHIHGLPKDFAIPVEGPIRRLQPNRSSIYHHYTFHLSGNRYLWGEHAYKEGMALGSFCNRVVSRGRFNAENGYTDNYILKIGLQDLTYANAKFTEINGETYIRTLCAIPSGDEILITYGSSYRMPYTGPGIRKIGRKRKIQGDGTRKPLSRAERRRQKKARRRK